MPAELAPTPLSPLLSGKSTPNSVATFGPLLSCRTPGTTTCLRNAPPLFGNLQVVAARQLNLDRVLFAATNSWGGVMDKIVSPQNIATGVSVTNLKGHEGVVFARAFKHSILLIVLLGLLVAA